MTCATPGRAVPIGATVDAEGVNYCLHSKHATGVALEFFDQPTDKMPSRSFLLDPFRNRTYDYWHIHVAGVKPGQLYGYRVFGQFNPWDGFRFDPSKLLVDPYARAVANLPSYQRAAACRPGDNAGVALKSVVVDSAAYDWEGDQPLQRRMRDGRVREEEAQHGRHVGRDHARALAETGNRHLDATDPGFA